MTKVMVFTPTYRPGGLDVSTASILRQTFKPHIWYIGDSFYPGREETLNEIAIQLPIEISFFTSARSERPQQKVRELCLAYNFAATLAIRHDCDLFISMQDYIWVPEDGIEKFVRLHEQNPDKLLTGLTDISGDPFPVRVWNKNGHYTIFKEPYYEKPKIISWEDSRDYEVYDFDDDTIHAGIRPEHWEANWAAVPVQVFRDGVFWDDEYDNGIAYENCDFAQRARLAGYETVLDRSNRSISLPHKRYWRDEEELIEKHSNRSRYESRWM